MPSATVPDQYPTIGAILDPPSLSLETLPLTNQPNFERFGLCKFDIYANKLWSKYYLNQ
jgi:hypothetical protein